MQGDNDKEIEKCIQKAVAEALGEEKRQRKLKILYNTRILMESYIEMRKHIENAISEAEEMKETEFGAFGGENAHLESVRRSKMKTTLMLSNIDRAMEELRAEQEENGTLYKYEAFRMHYVEGKTFEDVAEAMNCGKNTPSRWSKEMIRKMSVKLFGVDGIEKW